MMGQDEIRAMQEWVVTLEEDVLHAVLSVSLAEMAVRYGPEKIEDAITGMMMLDEFHSLAEAAREERREMKDVVEMQGHDIVAEARAILDES